jgi:septum formation protein
MPPKPFLFLASKSPRRKQILKKMRFSFRVVNSSYEETFPKGVSPRDLVLRHAVGKAKGAVVKSAEGFVLGADTLVARKGKIFGKPKNLKDARKMLETLSGKVHEVYTGVALVDLATKKIRSDVAKTKVYFKKLSPEAIENYIRRVNVLDKAGAYGIQEKIKIVRKIQGSYSNVVGLPEALIKKLIREER